MKNLVATLPCFLLISSIGWGVEVAQPEPAPDVPGQVKADFRPSYTVTPIVHKLEARRGQKLAFSFEVTSELENVLATVEPIALRQNRNGVMLPDLETPAPSNLRLKNRDAMVLKKDIPVTIEGTISVPANQSPFHSFGILIRDQGRESLRARQGASQFGINFVTQYILRCDIVVSNGRNDDIRKLVISEAQFVEFNGTPLAKVSVTNPTTSTVEFELDCRLLNDSMSDSKKYTRLASPVRERLVEPERWQTRIMPETTLDMFAPWPQAIFAGRYEMETRVVSRRRVYGTSLTELSVAEDQFRGQAAWVTQVAPNVHANPSQIALGQRKPYKRMQEIKIVNHSVEPVTVQLQAVDAQGNPLTWATVRPLEMTVTANTKRRAVAALTRVTDRESHQIGYLSVNTSSATGESLGQERIPVAFFGGDSLVPNLEVAQCTIQATQTGSDSVLVMPVTNRGSFPMPLTAIAQFADVANNPIQIHAGFGKWLLPGETENLDFPLSGAKIETGSMRGEVTLYDAADAAIYRQEVQLQQPAAGQL